MRRKLLELSLTSATHHRRSVYVVWAALMVVSVICLAWFGLGVDTSRQGMVGENDPDSRRFRAFGREFGATLNNVVVIDGENPEQNRKFADLLAHELRRRTDSIGAVIYRIEPKQFQPFALLYADKESLQSFYDLTTALGDLKWDSKDPVVITGLTDVIRRLNENLAKLEDGETEGLGHLADIQLDIVKTTDAVSKTFGVLRDALTIPDWSELALVSEHHREKLTSAGVDDHGYLSSHDGKLVFLFVQPASDSDQSEALRAFTDEILKTIDSIPHPELQVGVTGYPATIAAEMRLMIRDVIGTSIASVILVMLIFAIAYRSVVTTAIAMIPLVVGIIVTLGLCAATIGQINMLSSAFFSFLVGLGIDFSIHIIARFREERANGVDATDAITTTLMGTGIGVFTGGMTTIAAFLAAAYSDFTGMVELGLLSAAGLLFVLAAALTLLPCVLVSLSLRHRQGTTNLPHPTSINSPNEKTQKNRKSTQRWILITAVVATVGIGTLIRPLEFSFDVAELLPDDEPALLALQQLREENVFSPDFAAVVTDSVAHAQELGAALSKRPDLVARVESIATYLPPTDPEKEQLLTLVSKKLNQLPQLEFSLPKSHQADTLVSELDKLAAYAELDLPLTLRVHKQERFLSVVQKIALECKQTAEALRKVDSDTLSKYVARFDVILDGIMNDALTTIRSGKVHMVVQDLPDELLQTYWRKRETGEQRFAVRVFPKGSIADPQFMARFREFVVPLAPDITGLPITYLAWGNLLRDGLERSAILAICAIILLVFVDFRTIRHTILAILPLFVGTVWMVGLMNLLNIGYNFANIVAIPLILGIGVDSGVHMVHRLREGVTPHLLVKTAGKAITISSLTTVAAFGALGAAQHRGLQSLGQTLVLGVIACLIASVVVLPALLGLRKDSNIRS